MIFDNVCSDRKCGKRLVYYLYLALFSSFTRINVTSTYAAISQRQNQPWSSYYRKKKRRISSNRILFATYTAVWCIGDHHSKEEYLFRLRNSYPWGRKIQPYPYGLSFA